MDDEQSLRRLIGLNVKAELARRCLRQSDVARILGVGQPSVSLKLAGRVCLTATELARVARWLDVPIERFFEPLTTSEASSEVRNG
mgnify:CR=1 FL=1